MSPNGFLLLAIAIGFLYATAYGRRARRRIEKLEREKNEKSEKKE